MIVHAGCVARQHRGEWAGVLITGRSGHGKSDLTLRLMQRGWRLVGDDRVTLWASGDRLYARGPEPLAGLVEARGLGVCAVARRELAVVRLVVACADPASAIERMADRDYETLQGIPVERVTLHALEASAPAKVQLALARTGADL